MPGAIWDVRICVRPAGARDDGIRSLSHSTPGSFGDIGQALALLGRRTEALAELERLQRLSKVSTTVL